MSDVSRKTIDALLPPGPIWKVKEGSDFDELLEGIADNSESVREFLSDLSSMRDPELTQLLVDLQHEYNVLVNPNLTEAQQRMQLGAIKSGIGADGSAAFLQDQLQTAGFDVYVYENSPAVNPFIFLWWMFRLLTPQNLTAVCQLLTNGLSTDANFTASMDPGYWPTVFFIGGAATYSGNYLATIAQISISANDRPLFENLILKYKPLGTWCVYMKPNTDIQSDWLEEGWEDPASDDYMGTEGGDAAGSNLGLSQ